MNMLVCVWSDKKASSFYATDRVTIRLCAGQSASQRCLAMVQRLSAAASFLAEWRAGRSSESCPERRFWTSRALVRETKEL